MQNGNILNLVDLSEPIIMDDDIERLMQELEDAQNSDVSHKLSERTTVELIAKLMERKKIEVLNTRSGLREYLTWKQLETEIFSEIDSHDGRISFQELEECCNVDITYIEKSITKLIQSDCGIMKLNNQEIINGRYTDLIVSKTLSLVREKGLMKIGLIATRFNIPVSYLNSEIIPEMMKIDPSIRSKGGEIFTQDYIRRIQRRIHGIMTALEKPSLLSEICDFHHIEFSLFQETLNSFIKAKKIQGTIKAGSFIPQSYEDKKSNAVISFLRDNQYITKKLLKDNRIDNPVDYLLKAKQNMRIMELDSVWIQEDLITDLTDTMIEFCNEDGFVDVTTIIPTPFTKEDCSLLFKNIDKMSTDLTEEKNCMYLLLQDYVVQANFLYTLLEEYKSNSNAIIQNCINVNKSVDSIMPKQEDIIAKCSEHFPEMEEECLQILASYLLQKIQGIYDELFKQLKKSVVKGEISSRKLDQKEASAAVLSFYHNYLNTLKIMEGAKSKALQDKYQRVEKDMRTEGVCYVLRFLQILNDCVVTPFEELKKKNINELRELCKELPKEVMEYVIALIAMINPKKKQKEASKPKDDVDESSKKKGKKQGKGGKKGKQVEEEEEVEKEEKEEVYLDVFMKVTDFGGPLFKPHDRKQLRQLVHGMKMEIFQQLEMIILQSISEKECIALASLALINKYSFLPYVPNLDACYPILADYADSIADEKKEEYLKLIQNVNSESVEEMKQAVYDLVPFFHQKE